VRTVLPCGRVRDRRPHLDAACHGAGKTALQSSGWLPQYLLAVFRYVVHASSGRSRETHYGPFDKLDSNARRRIE